MIGAQLAAVLEFRFSGGLLRLNPALAVGLGAAAVVVGFSVRLWAIATLNQYFTSTVEVKSGQEVVRTGPYAWVRHPSYTGALVIAAGMLLMLRSGTGLLLLVVAVTPAYAYRINVEERALVGELGEEYVRYRNDVPALLPKLARHRVPLR
jgi:protein-S-isoprenylcysteine O-methyltransferase Ste14